MKARAQGLLKRSESDHLPAQEMDAEGIQSSVQNECEEVITDQPDQSEEQEPDELIDQPHVEHKPRLQLVTSGLDQLKLAKVRRVLKKHLTFPIASLLKRQVWHRQRLSGILLN
jgi:hypothetical protein